MTYVYSNVPALDIAGVDAISIPFLFHVPEPVPQSPVEEASQILCFPPSLTVGARNLLGSNGDAQASAVARYEVEARLCTGERVVRSVPAEIRIYITLAHVPPPVSLDDFPQEYTCSLSKPLRRKKQVVWSSSKASRFGDETRLTVTVLEPSALRLDPRRDQDHPVIITLAAEFSVIKCSRGAKVTDQPPDNMDVVLNWLLESTTFISLVPMHQIPTRKEAFKSPFVASPTTSSPWRTAKMSLHRWKAVESCVSSITSHGSSAPLIAVPARGCSSSESAKEHLNTKWRKEETLHLALTPPSDSMPTFFTPRLSRRYSLQLYFEFQQHEKAAHFNLKVPVQIIWVRGASVR